MLHIFLTILKIIGILFLSILGILLLIVLSVLLIPICYEVEGEKEEKTIQGSATVSWLFRGITAKYKYEIKEGIFEVYLFGIPLLATIKKYKQWKEKRAESKKRREDEKAKKEQPVQVQEAVDKSNSLQNTIEDKETSGEDEVEKVMEEKDSKQESDSKSDKAEQMVSETSKMESQAETEKHTETAKYTEKRTETSNNKETEKRGKKTRQTQQNRTKQTSTGKKSGFGDKIKNLWNTICGIPKKIKEICGKIRLTIKQMYDKMDWWKTFLQKESTQKAIRFLFGEGKALLKHILPRKLRGRVCYGLEDPALTGQILAAFSVCYPYFQDDLEIVPFFDRTILEGKLKISGRIVVGYLVWHAIKIICNEETRKTYKILRRKEA